MAIFIMAIINIFRSVGCFSYEVLPNRFLKHKMHKLGLDRNIRQFWREQLLTKESRGSPPPKPMAGRLHEFTVRKTSNIALREH